MGRHPVTNYEIKKIACDVKEFQKAWERIVSLFVKDGVTKKIVDKIRTIARNNREDKYMYHSISYIYLHTTILCCLIVIIY